MTNLFTYINKENQEAFIVIIINYELQVFFCVCYAKYYFLKKCRPQDSNNVIFILPTDRPFFFFFCFAVLSVDQKINLFSPY